uniref:Cathepsin O n=1 Tax=Equus caballus TaxID=9796 RepID=A0A3Q2H9R7_HORSE
MELQALWRLWLLCCCCCCCICCGSSATFTSNRPRSGDRQAAAFRESLNRHRYLNSLFPSENSTAVYGINQFSYLFPEEFKAIYLRSKPSRFPRYPAEVQTSLSNVSLPLRFDWRDRHVVTQVRNQQACGGCWAFSVVGAVESVCAIKGEPLEDLSVQQVIDCSYNNYGCSGGSTLNALNWLNKTQVKLVRDSEYPFKAQSGLCHYFSDSHSGFSIKGFSAYDFSDQEDQMAKALLTFGPLVVVVDAVSWQDYLGGVIQHHCSSGEANHAVLITGFDRTGSTPYWIVRNSWGSSWGVDGYAHVKMGGNICVVVPGSGLMAGCFQSSARRVQEPIQTFTQNCLSNDSVSPPPPSPSPQLPGVLQIPFLLYLCDMLGRSRDHYKNAGSS